MGVVPPWCKVVSPSGGMLETRRTYYEIIDWIPFIVGNPGDKIKISFLVCASDLFSVYDEIGQTWYRDSVDFGIYGSYLGGELDRFYIFSRIEGDPNCAGWYEDAIEYPDFCNYYFLYGNFKDLKWYQVEFEKVIPSPWVGLDQWRVQIMVDQVQYYQGPSNSVFWFDEFKVFLNDVVIWERNFDPPPDVDPPPISEGDQIVKASKTPWVRYDKPVPECTGEE